jgi:hypothetical protein
MHPNPKTVTAYRSQLHDRLERLAQSSVIFPLISQGTDVEPSRKLKLLPFILSLVIAIYKVNSIQKMPVQVKARLNACELTIFSYTNKTNLCLKTLNLRSKRFVLALLHPESRAV